MPTPIPTQRSRPLLPLCVAVVVGCLAATQAVAHRRHDGARGPQPPMRTISAEGDRVDGASTPSALNVATADVAAPPPPALIDPARVIAATDAVFPAPPAPVQSAQLDDQGVIHSQSAASPLRPYGVQWVRPRRVVVARTPTVRAAPATIAAAITRASQVYGVDPALVKAVMQTESGFHASARSGKGAQGLMQLMPQTAARFGVNDPYDPEQNIQGGVAYLAWLLHRYAGNTTLAIAGYNAGEGAVDRWGGIPPFSETRQYVLRVQSLYNQSSWYPSAAGGSALASTSSWRLIDAAGDHALN